MGWETFNVVTNGNDNADGQCQFTTTLSADKKTMTSAELDYARNSNPTPPQHYVVLFNDTTTHTADASGKFSLGPYTISPKITIPAAGPFNGGSYNTLNVVYDPGANKLTGTFSDVDRAPGGDPDCSWEANVSAMAEERARKAGS